MTKEEYSEYAYKQMIDETWLDENGEFEVVGVGGLFGHHYRGADDWEQSDNSAFREGYNAWLDGLEKDGVDTGAYESKAKLDTVEAIDDYVKNANEDATGSDIGSDYLNKQLMELPYDEQQDRLSTARDEQSPLHNI